MNEDDDVEFLINVIRRLPFLTELRQGPRTRKDLAEALGLSSSTVYRATTELAKAGLVERRKGRHALTGSGEAVTYDAGAFRNRAISAWRLAPLYETLAGCPVEIDPSLFADATVTVAAPGAPYAPVRRFGSLVDETDELVGFDTTAVDPSGFRYLADRIHGGMVTEVVYEPTVVERLAATHPKEVKTLSACDHLDVLVHEDLPFGLALFDDRVGLGGYEMETGVLRTYVDTDDPDALTWAESVYESYREEAVPVGAA